MMLGCKGLYVIKSLPQLEEGGAPMHSRSSSFRLTLSDLDRLSHSLALFLHRERGPASLRLLNNRRTIRLISCGHGAQRRLDFGYCINPILQTNVRRGAVACSAAARSYLDSRLLRAVHSRQRREAFCASVLALHDEVLVSLFHLEYLSQVRCQREARKAKVWKGKERTSTTSRSCT